MSQVTKKNGKFILVATPHVKTRLLIGDDETKIKKPMSETELRQVIERILIRLKALEQ